MRRTWRNKKLKYRAIHVILTAKGNGLFVESFINVIQR